MEVLLGKSSVNGPFSIAMLNYQRVFFFWDSKSSQRFLRSSHFHGSMDPLWIHYIKLVNYILSIFPRISNYLAIIPPFIDDFSRSKPPFIDDFPTVSPYTNDFRIIFPWHKACWSPFIPCCSNPYVQTGYSFFKG